MKPLVVGISGPDGKPLLDKELHYQICSTCAKRPDLHAHLEKVLEDGFANLGRMTDGQRRMCEDG